MNIPNCPFTVDQLFDGLIAQDPAIVRIEKDIQPLIAKIRGLVGELKPSDVSGRNLEELHDLCPFLYTHFFDRVNPLTEFPPDFVINTDPRNFAVERGVYIPPEIEQPEKHREKFRSSYSWLAFTYNLAHSGSHKQLDEASSSVDSRELKYPLVLLNTPKIKDDYSLPDGDRSKQVELIQCIHETGHLALHWGTLTSGLVGDISGPESYDAAHTPPPTTVTKAEYDLEIEAWDFAQIIVNKLHKYILISEKQRKGMMEEIWQRKIKIIKERDAN